MLKLTNSWRQYAAKPCWNAIWLFDQTPVRREPRQEMCKMDPDAPLSIAVDPIAADPSGAEATLGAALAALRLAEARGDADASDAARLVYYAALAAQEICVALETSGGPAAGDSFAPRTLALGGGPVVLAFDDEAYLAAFAPEGAEFVMLAGRDLMQAMAGQGLGLGMNLASPQRAYLLDAAGVDWLAALVSMPAPRPRNASQIAQQVLAPPDGVPGMLAALLVMRLALWPGAIQAAVLLRADAQVVLVVIGVAPATQPALAHNLAEAARFAGFSPQGSAEGTAPDFAQVFVDADDPLAAKACAIGRALPVAPAAPSASHHPGAAPGLDPDRPPNLR